MLQAKLKKCDGCSEVTTIWKREGTQKFCKQCWTKQFKGLSSTKKPTAKKPMRLQSSKIVKLNAAYSILREQYMKHHPHCEAHLAGCAINACDIHHKKGRVGNLFLDDTEFLAVCRTCHGWIETHPKEAKLLNFSKSRESNE
jgi:hypothetical protein